MMLLATMQAGAQQMRPAPSAKIYHEIARLKNLVHVLYVAAHPDDENTRLLAWLVNDQHIRTAYLSLTRGDGGQNILGPEQGDALGLIRTHELLEARKIDGAEQYFTRAIDFGFSKTYQETFRHWNKDTLVGDAVRVMRQYRPDVVICRFPPDTMAGHGHHASSALIGAAAFKAAGDAGKYSEQLHGLQPWQPTRIVFNAYRFGSFSTVSDDMFKLKTGQYLPLLGMSTGELAGASRTVHKSQGAGTPGVPGLQDEYFRLVDGQPFQHSIFDGIDISWSRVGRPEIGGLIDELLHDFDFIHPENSIPGLISLRAAISNVTDEYWRTEKLADLDQVILDCSGFMAELYCNQAVTTAGTQLPFTLHLIARAGSAVTVKKINWEAGNDTTADLHLAGDSLYTLNQRITIPANTPVTQPYWLKEKSNGALFTVTDRKYLGLPETPDELQASVTLDIGGVEQPIKVPLSYKKLDPLKGDVVEALRIVPEASVGFSSPLLITNAEGAADAEVQIHAFAALNDTLVLTGEKGAVLFRAPVSIAAGADTTIAAHISIHGATTLSASVVHGGRRLDHMQHVIQYSHLPALQYFTKAEIKVIRPEWKCAVHKIGYIEGAGDFMPTLLSLAGLDVDILKEKDLGNAARLKKYDAIVTGIRSINVEKRMSAWMPVLLQYVNDGGTLLMQYNTLQDPVTNKFGPYPITLSSKRVTEEDAAITFTDSTAKMLHYPNRITQEDFTGWVQERGLYFASKWDEHYHTLFSMHDEGEQPQEGSTLFAKVGKGNYIYTSLSYSRQLPAGNTGAIRLLMNMLSIGK